jgi:hypothetical protein
LETSSDAVKLNTLSKIEFESESEDVINRVMSSVQFCSSCIGIEGTANVRGKVVEYQPILIESDDYLASSETFEVRNSIEVLDNTLPIQASASSTQTIAGSVADSIGKLPNVSVIASLPGCQQTWTT